ncbi:MAG: hypothetical protein EBU88_06900 [Acidobacteria bacterium]|nr:hypothetical protein [Acidobacteriota bacterium]
MSATLADGIVSPLPPLDDMRCPVRLRMGAFREKRETWAKAVEDRVGAILELPQLDTLTRLERIKAEALSVAREVLGTTGGKLRPPIRFHSKESIRLMKLLRTVKAARKDILSRKDLAAATGVRPSRAMLEVWDRGLVPSGGAFSSLTDPFSRQHVQFTSDWLSLLRETVDQILTDLKKLRDSERKQAEAQSRRAAIQQMYEGRGALRRFLHDSEPHAPAPFLLTPLPNRITFSCANVDPRDIMESIKQIDQRIRVSHVLDQITVREIPPSSLHRVLSTPGIGPGVHLTSQGGLVSSPHDRLTCWEFKLATDGLATRSRCSCCNHSCVVPVPYSDGSSRRIEYYCPSCGTFRELAIDPGDYAQIDFLDEDRIPRVPPGAPERLAKPISREDLDWYLSTLPSHKAPGPDGLPYECLKYAPPCFREVVFEAVNQVLTQTMPMPSHWKGGLIRYLFKSGDTSDMSCYRPVCLQDSVYKVVSAVLTDRLYRIVEQHGLLSDSQEGFRRLRSTTRQAQSLQWAIEDAKATNGSLYVAYLDFENAFNSTDHEALWRWLDLIGVPDVDLLRSLYKDAFYRAEFPYGSTANIHLTRGKKQGDLISPLLFELLFNVYLLALEATSGGLVRLTHRPRAGMGFADDVAIVATSASLLQKRLDKTAEFCAWSGMRVKIKKSVITGYDFGSQKEADVSNISYGGQALLYLPATEAFRYLGIRIALTGSFQAERKYVLDSVTTLQSLVKGHKYNLDQMVGATLMVASSRFRYSAPLVPWPDAELNRLHLKWIGLAKVAWKVHPGFPAAPFKFPTSQAGSPVPHPRVYLVQALSTHIEQLVALPDELRDRTIRQYRQLCQDTGCNTARELADLLSCERRPRECPIARLLRACGQLDLAVKLPDCLSLGPGENETSWHGLFMQIRKFARDVTATDETRKDFETVSKSWPSFRSALHEKGYSQPRMLLIDAKAAQPQWRLEAFDKPMLRPLHRLLQHLPSETRRRMFPPLFRGRRPIAQELHRELIHDTLQALRAPLVPDASGNVEVRHLFRDPRWSRVKCCTMELTWRRLLHSYGLDHCLVQHAHEIDSVPGLVGCSGIVRDLCILGLSGRVPPQTLTELLRTLASSFKSLPSPDARPSEEHPLHRQELCLNRELVHIVTEDPPVCVVNVPPWRITTRDNRSKVVRIPDGESPPVHVGTVAQGRFSRLCDDLGQQRVLASLPSWIQQVEKSESTRGVASAQFWRGLRDALKASGYIGGPELLLPPYFKEAIAADDDSIKIPLPSGAYALRTGRYVVDLLHKDASFQERMRVHFANPSSSRSSRAEFLVVTRPSTLERDTEAMLGRRYTQLHTIPKGSIVVARKGNWSSGAFHAVQSSEDWSVWAPASLPESERLELRERLTMLVFSRDGLVPFDPACPSMREIKLGTSGQIYSQDGLIAATDGSVKRDGSMGASACWSRPDLAPVSFEVHGPPKSIVPELFGVAVAAEKSPTDEDLKLLTDSKSSLQLLRGMQRQDFPVFLHRRPERRLLERVVRALNRRAEAGVHTHLIKVKAHSGEPLNTLADHLATSSAGQDPTQAWLDPHTVYFYLQDRPIVWGSRLRSHLSRVAAAKDYERFLQQKVSRDPNPADADLALLSPPRLMNWCETWMARQGMGRALIGAALESMETDSRKRRVLQTLANMFPGRALLHKWNRVDSPTCSLCNSGRETVCHIQCQCSRLEAARTAAHHQVARCLWSVISKWQRGNKDDFTIADEVEIRNIRDLAPPRCGQTWDALWARFFQDPVSAPPHPPLADLARLRPDAVAIRWDKRCMYLLEVTRPYDSRPDFAARSDRLKVLRYQPVIDRFEEVGRGWKALVIPLTVGIRGSLDQGAWSDHLASLDIAPREVPRVLHAAVRIALAALDTVYDARQSKLQEAAR